MSLGKLPTPSLLLYLLFYFTFDCHYIMTDGFVHYLASQYDNIQGSVGPGTQMSSAGSQSPIQDCPTEDANKRFCTPFKAQL
jgi:hypothetical protein